MRSFILTLGLVAALAIAAMLPERASAQGYYYNNYAPNVYGTNSYSYSYVPPVYYYVPQVTTGYYYSSGYVPGANYYAPSFVYNPPVYIAPTYNPPVYAPAYYTPQYSMYYYVGRRRGYYFPLRRDYPLQ